MFSLGLPTHWCAIVGWPVRTYIYPFCVITKFRLEDLPGTMDDGADAKRKLKNSTLTVQLDNDIYILVYLLINKNFSDPPKCGYSIIKSSNWN